MSIFIDNDTKLVVQGITGRDGSFHTLQTMEYGTNVVAGVTPGKGGQTFEGPNGQTVPIFNAMDEAVAETGTPTLVMTSWNPVERRGVERFAQQLDDAGGAGLITPDIIPEFAPEWIAAADARDLDKVFLVAPSSTDERIATTTAQCRGFVYATGIMGVTGTTQATAEGVAPLIARTRATTDLPVGVGVGVSTGAQAAALSEHADAIIVGTAFVRTLLDHADDRDAGLAALRTLTEELAGGVRRA